jgi:TRAP-type C4-dicarboxylate transport system permease small subunit
MKKTIIFQATFLTFLLVASPVYAQSADVDKVTTFIQSVIQVLVTLAGFVAAGFIVWGGIGYITSSGNPEALEKSKRTILYSAVGLTLVLGAFVISNIVDQLATTAFGAGQ